MIQENVILGRLVQADNRGFVFACSSDGLALIEQGQLVFARHAPVGDIYGVVAMISWSSDDFVQQIAQTDSIHPGLLVDNVFHRLAGPAIRVMCVGYTTTKAIYHNLPPQPPLRLEQIHLCNPVQVRSFSTHSHAYLRLIVQNIDLPQIGDLLGAHLRWMHPIHQAAGNPAWSEHAFRRSVHYLLTDPRLPDIVEAIVQANPFLFREIEYER